VRAAGALLLVLLAVLPGAPAAGVTPPGGAGGRISIGAFDPSTLKPDIVWKPIPYGSRRRSQMAAYSGRHYGVRRWELTRKVAIVEHYTTGTTWQGAWNTFAANSKHLGEYPGTCTHFLIHTDGTIYQLVPLSIRCRHAIGLNQLSIGIEHVGRSDAEVMGNEAQIGASLRLTLWLVARYRIQVRNVIGHGESLDSPLRYERYASWKCMTHTDFSRPAMRTYRGRLRDRATAIGVPVGPPPAWVDIGC
jgi:N-acetylmuramoyl-L-alanine amidase